MEKKYVTDYPHLMEQWDFEKNNALGIDPSKTAHNSHLKVWWKCEKRHEWQASIANKKYGTGCPFCAGRKVLAGFNDLHTANPILANEWNYAKNFELTPLNVTPNSNKRVWWICNKGHEWQATVYNRSYGYGCPICNSERHTSLPEFALIFYLEKFGLKVHHSFKAKGYELDIYIPSMKIAIEYDGYFWHKNKIKKDLAKNAKCKRDGIKLFRIRAGLPPLNDSSIDYVIQENQKDLPNALEKIFKEITNSNVDIDLKRDAIDIENLREYTEKENSLLFSNPCLASEWNYNKNGSLKPEHFTIGSGKKVWWKCENEHEWRATIASRNSGNGCPYCSGRYIIKGENDLQTVNPALTTEWNCEKNGDLSPMDVSPKSNKKAWWKCKKGHEWQATISHRNNGNGCPYCSGRFVIKGTNDLQTVNPTLAKEWNYEKNGNLTPMDVLSHSDKKVWWKCGKGHEWESTIDHRTNGRGCPYCSGRKILVGYNDLSTINPVLASEWNHERNGDLKPENFTANSGKKVWWKCKSGHEWEAKIQNRNNGRGCHECYKARRRKQPKEST